MDNPASLPIPGYSGTASTEVQQYWIDAAWRALQLEDRGLAARITAGDIAPAAAADVVYSGARRVLRNPDGVEEESGSLDDYTESWKRADETEDLYFTAAELRRLLPIEAATTTSFVGSIKYC